MAKNESTAVNALIEQVAIGRPAPRFDEELMFSPPPKAKKVSPPRISGTVPPMNGAGEVSPLPRSRTPNGTQRNVPQLAGHEPVRMSSVSSRARSIPPLPVASESMMKAFPPPPAPHAAQAMPAFSPSSLPLQSPPSTPPGRMLPTADTSFSAPTYLPPGTSDSWFVNSQNATTEVHRDSLTVQVQRSRPAPTTSMLGKLVVPLLLLVAAGIGVAAYFVFFEGQGTSTVAAGTPPAAARPAPAPAPSATEPAPALVAAEPAVASPSAFVDVRIDSKPSGATVMLVDQGKTTFLGTTPLDAALDPSRKYELVFTHGDRPTRVESIDPSAQKRVAVVLAPSAVGEPAVAKARVEAKPTTATDAKADTAAERRRAERRAARKARAAAKRAELDRANVVEQPAKEPAGEGVLMISSKPPCEIYIDGKATGLRTPQRSIALAAGKHKITLVNEAEQIKKTIAVQITADKPTKVIQDLMQ